ncbi:T9SS type A sorting domain-containing protein [Aquimarina sp. 2201CG14-23]|uniref:T9SS type A sorting domain-containing protein n=1 Tax=Aquimarina mycalae TaxID=3040073 RepID=UPI002477F516|nr:T9SS type A sorting domain-containing protein [Aquimarina sp. 2201CG14-23]MDH7448341.1 T9SS type A sorting domain-containing protein [Aquimarina sp. 2201CG14-23]
MNIPVKSLIHVIGFLCAVQIGTSQICDSFVVTIQSITNEPCAFVPAGSVEIEVSGGTAPYIYSIFDNTNTEITNSGPVSNDTFSFTNLLANDYRIEVEDANACILEIAAVVETEELVLNVAVIDVVCFGDANGEIILDVFGGGGEYTYDLVDTNTGTIIRTDGGPENYVFFDVEPGMYDIIATDIFTGCSESFFVSVIEPEPLVFTVSNSFGISCAGDNNGELTLQATGGVPPYLYSLFTNGVEVIPESTNTIFSNLPAADYEVRVVDTRGCLESVSILLEEPDALVLQLIEARDAFCFGDPSGSITLEVIGGVPPYEYTVDGIIYQASPSFTNLVAGNYTVSSRDSNACMVSFDVTINNPDPIQAEIDIDYVSVTDNTIEIIGNGGSPPFEYSLKQGTTILETNTIGIFNVQEGNYIIQLVDVNGCIYENELIISYEDANQDGIADNDEDVNGNGILDDDDTDGDGIPDYLDDDDDDNDGVDSIGEIDTSGKSLLKMPGENFLDTDEDDIPNHRDMDDDGDGILTIDEDYNGNGDPTDDDTDNSGVADYLEIGVALSIQEYLLSDRFSFFPNPADTDINLILDNLEGQSIEITLFNLQGKRVFNENYSTNQKEIGIDVSRITPGLYIVKIDNGKNAGIKRLIVK